MEENYNIYFSFDNYKNLIKDYLTLINIDIHDPYYKEDYAEIQDIRVFGEDFRLMPLSEFIERYLLDLSEIPRYYESIYDMGNTYELKDSQCDDYALAKEIIYALELDVESEDVVNVIFRSGGLIDRLNTYLNFDMENFDKTKVRYKREKYKILYFFYLIEHKYFNKTNVLMLMSKPSMENIDNSFLGMNTYNGMVIKFIKVSLERELSLPAKKNIITNVAEIVNAWDTILENANLLMDFLYGKGYNYDFKKIIQILESDSDEIEMESLSKSDLSPIETLYLKVVQHEYIGNIKDIIKLNSIQKEYDYRVPSEFVEEMINLYYNSIDIENVEQHIEENAFRLSKYVYLKTTVSKDEVRRIRKFKGKVHKWISFCKRAKPIFDAKEIANELQIVSVLQAIILDDKSETFDYAFHGWQQHMKHIPRVQGALKNNDSVLDALQCYWTRKVTDRWYANIGRADVRTKTRELEQACDNILLKILNQSNLDRMNKLNELNLAKIDAGLITTREQISAVQRLENYLHGKGFKYVDYLYRIRYVFLYPPECKNMCEVLITILENAIQNHSASYSCSVCTVGPTGDVPVCINFVFAFDYNSNKCIMQEFELKSAE